MDKHPVRTGLTLASAFAVTAAMLLLAGDGAHNLAAQTVPQDLLSCQHHEQLFPSGSLLPNDFRSKAERWRDTFTATVNNVVQAHLDSTNSRTVCTGGARVTASDELAALAKTLPPWSDGAPFTEADMPAILLAYEAAYECALQWRANLLFSSVKDDAQTMPSANGAFYEGTSRDVVLPLLVMEVQDERTVITREISVAPRTMHKLLRYMAGTDRLRTLESNLRCLERASLDIRNIMSLNADIAACSYASKGQASLKDLAQ